MVLDDIHSSHLDSSHQLIRPDVRQQIYSLRLDMLERKNAKLEHLLRKEQRRGRWREEEADRYNDTDRWANKVLSAFDSLKAIESSHGQCDVLVQTGEREATKLSVFGRSTDDRRQVRIRQQNCYSLLLFIVLGSYCESSVLCWCSSCSEPLTRSHSAYPP